MTTESPVEPTTQEVCWREEHESRRDAEDYGTAVVFAATEDEAMAAVSRWHGWAKDELHPRDALPADLKAMRKMAGLTRGQVAELILLSSQVVIDWEDGKYRPTEPLAVQLSEHYGCG